MELNKLKTIAAVLLVLIISAVTFLPSLQNDFTNWDDPAFITENPDIREVSFKTIAKFFTHSYGGFAGYVPLVLLSYAVEYALFGLNPEAYHGTNVFFHLINCVLVFWFIYILSQKLPVAFMVSLLFGVHPLHVEAVAWIQGRKDLLFSLFYLAALIAFTRYLKKGKPKSLYIWTLVFFLCSLFSKVTALSLPFALLLLDFFISNRGQRPQLKRYIPFFLLAVLFLILAFLTVDTGSFAIPEAKVDYLGNILLFFYSFIFYINKILLPIGLSARYPVEISQLASPFLLVLSIAIFSVLWILLHRFYRTRKHEVTFGVLFFLVTLLPTIPFHFIRQPYADRYTYLPVIGIFYLAAFFLYRLYSERFKGSKKAGIFLLAAFTGLTLTLAAAGWNRCLAWKDSLTLWNDVLETHPNLSLAYLNRGEIYLRKGEMEKAISDLDQAVALNPANAHAYNNRGIYYFRNQQNQKALAEYNKALAVNPHYFNAYLNRGNVWGRLGFYQRAEADYNRALSINPHSFLAYFYRGITYRSLGKLKRAVQDFETALKIEPDARVEKELFILYKKIKEGETKEE